MKLKKKLEMKDAPHWLHVHSTRTLIWKSSVSLFPLLLALTFFDWKNTLGSLLGSLAFGFGFEYAFRILFESKSFLKNGDLFLICVLLAPLLPTPVNLQVILSAVFFACVIARFSFGGRGEAVFYSVPVGILGSGLFLNEPSASSLLAAHSNWFVLIAMGLGSLVMLKTKMTNLKMAVLFLTVGILTVLICNPGHLLFKTTLLFYAAIWILPDSPKPMSKPAQICFSILAGILAGLFSMKLNFTHSVLLGLLCVNGFAFSLDDFFATRRLKIITK